LNKKYQKTQKISNKIIQLQNHNNTKSLKIVFLGRPGSGKTTAVTSASSTLAYTSDVSTTDMTSILKDKTTIGIDYGEFNPQDNIKLRLYGTPGQRRYDYVQTQTVAKADIYIILIDLSSVAPFAEFMYYKEIIEFAGNENALRLAAFTHYDLKEHSMTQLCKEIRHKHHGEILTVKIDTRNQQEVRNILSNLAHYILDKNTSLSQIYQQNHVDIPCIDNKSYIKY
jgi:small GTP-binding protein